jgi:hypothetical protein
MVHNLSMKPKRIKDPMLLNSMRGDPCIICNQPGISHHVKSVGSGGHDIESNLVSLCGYHHNEIHLIGRVSFCRKYEKFFDWCQDNGHFSIIDKINL